MTNLLLLLLLMIVPAVTVAEVLKGVVLDLGSNNAHAGISGVRISVEFEEKGSLVAYKTVSDATGKFAFNLPLESKGAVAHFTKVGFQPRPKIQSVSVLKSQRGAVYLMRERTPSKYLRTVARNVVDVSAGFDEEAKSELAEVIANLSSDDREMVKAEIERSGAKGMSAAIDDAVEGATLTKLVRVKLISSPLPKGYQIDVETFKGTVTLSGFVDSSDDKETALATARAVEGVANVKDSIRVKPEG